MPHKIHSVQIHQNGGSAINIPDVASQSVETAFDVSAEVAGGQQSPTTQLVTGITRNPGFTTVAIKALLDEIGMDGAAIDSTGGAAGVTYFAEQFSKDGVEVSGSVHRSLQFKYGYIFPQTLECDHRGNATLTVGIAVIRDGSNAAIVISDTAALPTLIASVKFGLGPITLGGVSITDFRRLSIDFGNNMSTFGVDGDIEDSHVEGRTHSPIIRVTGVDAAVLAAAKIPIGGKSMTHANTKLYLRKRKQSGASGYEDDATAEHISFTMDGLALVTTPFSGDGRDNGEATFEMRGKDDGTNAPLIYNGATAIT